MATFITTVKFTDKGIAAISETANRAEGFRSTAEKMGAKILNVYWTLGPTDGVLIFEAPDDETATAAMMQLAGRGMVHTMTARAFNASEMSKIIAKLSH